jgi:hypothetical protein
MSNDHTENEYTEEVADGVSGDAGGDMWARETQLRLVHNALTVILDSFLV